MEVKPFSSLVRGRRIKLGLTQTDLAEALGYKSYVSIVRIEVNGYIPEHAIILRLAKALKIPLGDLVNVASEQLKRASDWSSIIRRVRIKTGLSQKEVAIGLRYKSQASYARIEWGEKVQNSLTKQDFTLKRKKYTFSYSIITIA